MPKALPAILTGALAGFIIGPFACVVATRMALEEATLEGQAAVEAAARLTTPARSWLGEVLDHLEVFGPPADAQYFLLARDLESDEDADAEDSTLAVVALRRLDRPGHRLLEREVVFREGGVRIHHTERIDGNARRLVWREFAPRGPRTWMAEWRDDADAVRTVGYGWDRPVHERLEGTDAMVGPLELLERLESGAARFDVDLSLVDPTAAAVEAVQVRTVDSVERAECAATTVRRTDGSLVLEAVLRADAAHPETAPSIETLRFHDGAAVATPIDESEYLRRRRRWKVDTVPAHEAVLAIVPDRR